MIESIVQNTNGSSSSSYIATINDTPEVNNNDTETLNKLLQKRSIPYHRRESIKIVPGGYHLYEIHKRSVNGKYDYLTTSTTAIEEFHKNEKNDDMIARCCEFKECKCYPPHESKCIEPHCEKPLIKSVKRKASAQPGDCCDEYECIKPTYCESKLTRIRYQIGAVWEESDCQTCRCINGEIECQMYFCKPLSCTKRIIVPGDCCEKCDENETDFCTGEANCNIHCTNGFQKSESGCNLCRCATTKTYIDLSDPTTDVQILTQPNNNTTEIDTSDNHTVMSTNIQAICKDQLQEYIVIFVGVIFLLLVIIFIIVLYIVMQKRHKHNQSYRPVANIDSNSNSLASTCSLRNVQQYDGV